MNRVMKYVVVRSEEHGEQLFVFPSNLNHSAESEVLSYIKTGSSTNWSRTYREPLSAGFFDGDRCFGASETPNLKSRPDKDLALLKAGCHLPLK